MSKRTVAVQAGVLAWIAWCAPMAAGAATGGKSDPPLPAPAAAFLARALPDGIEGTPRSGRALFEQVLAGPAFVSGAVGPFDVHVFVGDALGTETAARGVLDAVLETLQPAADVVGRHWPEGGGGLISATRLPIVIVDPGRDGKSHEQVLSLLQHCEQRGYSGWVPANTVDSPANLGSEVTTTWEVQVYDLSHATIAARRKPWLEHGVGYYALSFIGFRALRQGSWGIVPPWLANGLADELDIEAYGTAWVGQEGWTAQTPGWFRPGWSGFVPEGQRPPAPITGPPADLAVKVTRTGDPWLDYDASPSRHWSELLADRKSEAPASFARAAKTESFLPRDRAAARCLLALMLEVAPAPDGALTALLDEQASIPGDGMPDSEALPVLFARSLGGVPEVDRLESLSSRALLEELGRSDLAARVTDLGAADLLDLSDHRKQSRWLYTQPQFDRAARGAVFTAILEIEYAQQMAEWKAISARLDGGLQAALAAARAFPVADRDLGKVREAFRAGLAADPATGPEQQAGAKHKSHGTSRSRR